MQQNPPGPGVSAGQEPTMELDGVEYILIPYDSTLSLEVDSSSPVPFLLYAPKIGEAVTPDDLDTFHTEKLERDDVYRRTFASRLVFYGLGISPQLEEGFAARFETLGVHYHEHVCGHENIASGPYVFFQKKVWQPWRIYHDHKAAFMFDCPKPDTDLRVIVPSRCYYTPSGARPLNGIRIGVKDNIDIAGHMTFLDDGGVLPELQPAAAHARCIQSLTVAGAIIVGKLKAMAFTYPEEPAISVTGHFDHRGDRPQVPRVSGSGSVVAICSYDWLDISFGSDSKWSFIPPPGANTFFANSYIARGTLPKPVVYNGCHAMRLTAGILNAEGVIAQFPDFGMPGFFGRDISKLTKMISVSSGRPCPLRKDFLATVEILCPVDYLSTANYEQIYATNRFIQGLELSFRTQRCMISIANLWEEDMPDGIENRDIAAYLKTAGICPLIRDSKEVSEALGDDDGAESTPSSSRPALKELAKLDFNKRVSEEKQAECVRRCEVYRDWLLSTIFKTDSEDKLKFMVFPALEGKSNRGDEPQPLDDLLNGYAPMNMSPILQAPELTVVVGKFSCLSPLTGKKSLHPFAVSVIGSPGTDLLVTKLVERGTKAAGILTLLKAGSIFNGYGVCPKDTAQ